MISETWTTSFQVGDVRIGSGNLFLIAGPCVIESEEHAIRMAEIIKGVARALGFPFIFKASYDKANRTSIRSFRGPGMKEGLRILRKIKNEIQRAGADRCARSRRRGQGGRSGRRSADSRVSEPADGSCGRGGFQRARGEYQEGAVRFARGICGTR